MSTNVLRDSNGARAGGITTCGLIVFLADGSRFSGVYWTAVVVDIIPKSVAVIAVVNVAALSEVLSRADAAYYQRLNEYFMVGLYAGAAIAVFPLGWGIVLVVWEKWNGEFCLNLALGTLVVMGWTLLASFVGALFLNSGSAAIAGQWKMVSSRRSQKKERREVRVKSGGELLGQDEKDTIEWA